MKVLIVGIAGQLGQCLVHCQPSTMELVGLSRSECDITDVAQLMASVQAIRPDVVINCAAFTQVDYAEQQPEQAYRVNALGAQHLAQAANSVSALLIQLSTDFVFDGQQQTAYRPSDIAQPINVYGASKLAGENTVRQFARKAIIVRTAWLFSEFGHGFVQAILAKAMAKQEPQSVLTVVADQIGTPTYAMDFARYLWALVAEHGGSSPSVFELLHFAGNQAVSRAEFAQAIVDCALHEGKLSHVVPIEPCLTVLKPGIARRPNCVVLATEPGQQSAWRAALAKVIRQY